jgi:UPF0148 protein
MVDTENRDKQTVLRKMTELLRAGATMLAETCPSCGSPLFKLKSGEIQCPLHGKIYLVSSEEEVSTATLTAVLNSVEELVASKLSTLVNSLRSGGDYESIELLDKWLDIALKIQEIRSRMGQPPVYRRESGRQQEKEKTK